MPLPRPLPYATATIAIRHGLVAIRTVATQQLLELTQLAHLAIHHTIADTYRPQVRSLSNNVPSIHADGDPNQGGVDREFSRERLSSTLILSHTAENRQSGISLRGRLSPTMDIETIQNLILLTPHHKFLPDTGADTAEEPSGYPSPTSLKEDLSRLSVSNSTASSPRRASLQPAPMIPIHSTASSRVSLGSSSEQPTSPGGADHARH
ncbi:hypothetical protein PTTG_26356 [Puccinia triticina 1-1 BBBD Race 1]|uniref:Uncharacterized protein n=1 Tax=Puccinia triticina (isolate 1-1 / race 1 (BBBD)) TaxID=630390 RepID=A0A180GVC9_PUCT1|nr:hypothetical protein PTTG_26356 [Puccinia triticina 1-1 BBBD Race 1]